MSPVDEFAIVSITLLLLITGLSWQVKYSTVFGGGTLMLYLCVLLGAWLVILNCRKVRIWESVGW